MYIASATETKGQYIASYGADSSMLKVERTM